MSKHVTRASIMDTIGFLYTREQALEIIDAYPDHERDARAKGIPMLGSGRVFPIDEEQIKFRLDQQRFPDSWVWIAGIDFGVDHPTAAVKACYDRDSDVIYITQCYKRKGESAIMHAAALRSWGTWLPWAWPHDGNSREKGSGKQTVQFYRDAGLKMLANKAEYVNGSYALEDTALDMLTRMQTGRLQIADHLFDWFEEFRLYHRLDGRIVKKFDDLMSATRYMLMCLRFATREGVAIGEDYGEHEPISEYAWMM